MSDGDNVDQAGVKPAAEENQAEATQQKPKTKRARADKGDALGQGKPAKAKPERDPSKPRIKRGPARPHRRLTDDIIDARITKLQKRLERASSQIEDAGRHVEGYLRERDFRKREADKA